MSGTSTLHDLLKAYQPHDLRDALSRETMLDLLAKEERCFWRDCFVPGHFTGSAWVVNPARSKVLLLHHKGLNKWLQPGGHADGDPNLQLTALREAAEETGVAEKEFNLLGRDAIYDVDVHPIPARPSRGEPEHNHYDVRFLFELGDDIPLPGSFEANAVAWVPLETVEKVFSHEHGMRRMVERTLAAA